jgi:hypothetical protein
MVRERCKHNIAAVSPQRIERFGIFEPAGVQQLLAEQTSGRVDHTQLLWALFHLDRWHEKFIEAR